MPKYSIQVNSVLDKDCVGRVDGVVREDSSSGKEEDLI